ncbi:MAG: DUF3592 domain-containing protein [Microscillaceae bacterium]|nr:DUF3592 domain-containing protein [Microscillaceae bacterium]
MFEKPTNDSLRGLKQVFFKHPRKKVVNKSIKKAFENMYPQYTEINFKWSNFLQGGLIFYVGGLYFFYRFVLVMSIFISQYSWIATSATVTQSSVSQTQEMNSRVRTYANFEYAYEVKGKPYKSSVFAATQLSLNSFEGVEKFKKGAKITIFYNPRSPKNAVVERKAPSFFVYFGLVVAFLFLFLGTGLTFLEM